MRTDEFIGRPEDVPDSQGNPWGEPEDAEDDGFDSLFDNPDGEEDTGEIEEGTDMEMVEPDGDEDGFGAEDGPDGQDWQADGSEFAGGEYSGDGLVGQIDVEADPDGADGQEVSEWEPAEDSGLVDGYQEQVGDDTFYDGEDDGDLGAAVEGFETSDEDYETSESGADFITPDGSIVVQDMDDSREDHFELVYIDIADIASSRRVRKLNRNSIDNLASSVRSTGLLLPPVVAPLEVPGKYVLIKGLRRLLACAKAGMTKVPCIVNNKIRTSEIPIVEAMYNHSTKYTVQEMLDYIEYLEKERGIRSASFIEYLLQMENGDYMKLKDIINDNDEDIVSKLKNGQLTIQAAFKLLEKRRKNESRDEKESKQVQGAYLKEDESGAGQMAGSGEQGDKSAALTDEELQALSITSAELDSGETELTELVAESDEIKGFQANVQDPKNRTPLDPALRDSILARDGYRCRCCGLQVQTKDVFDVHHISMVALGGNDSPENLVCLCILCHRLVHLFGRGDLYLKPADEMDEDERKRFTRIVKLGTVIRKQMAARGMKREELKKVDNAKTIGRTFPGTGQIAD